MDEPNSQTPVPNPPLPILTGDKSYRPSSAADTETTVADGNNAPSRDTPPTTPATLFAALPRTVYVWFVVILLTYLLPFVADGGLRKARREAQKSTSAASGSGNVSVSAPLNDKEFTTYLTAESQTRVAYATRALFGSVDGATTQGLQSAGIQVLRQSIADYRKLAKSSGAPNMARKVLILQNQIGVPFDDLFVQKMLVPALEKNGVSKTEILRERELWAGLYAFKKLPANQSVVAAVDRIKAMQLRFLEAQALADLHDAVGQTREANQYRAALNKAASTSAGKLFALNGTIFVAFLAGIVLFIVYLVAAFTKKWTLVKRVATQPQVSRWPAMLDVFLFYLAVMRGGGFLFGVAFLALNPNPNVATEIAAEFGFSLFAGLAAVAYLAWGLKKRGATLADIGFRATTRGGVWAEIGYGIVGYCATLPPFLLLQLLSRALFQTNTNTVPNPVFPLITSAADSVLLGFLLFGLVAVFVPVFEETFFRGALFTGLRARFSWPIAAMISAVFFALLHPPQDWIGIFMLGCSFATMREMRQSLYPSMTAHFIQNSFAFLATSTIFAS